MAFSEGNLSEVSEVEAVKVVTPDVGQTVEGAGEVHGFSGLVP
jgi:hypothetical protein